MAEAFDKLDDAVQSQVDFVYKTPAPRKWEKRWVQVGHFKLFKWMPGTMHLLLHGSV